jgi:LacI family transcriptional regulator
VAYAHAHTRWFVSRESRDTLAGALRAGEMRGLIAQAVWPEIVRMLRQCGLPVVNVSNRLARQPFPLVGNDDGAIGRVAAEYLLSRGFRQFGYAGFETHFSWVRGEAFARTVRAQGCACATFAHERRLAAFPPLLPWLRSLSRPCAVMGADDNVACRVVNTALDAGIRVPEDLSVIGVENDPILCDLAFVPLSSVQSGAEKIGYEAARALDRLLHGGQPPAAPVLIPPVGVVTRRSTELIAVADPAVAAALQFIRAHAHEALRPRDVIGHLPHSRRGLEMRFRRALGRSIGEEILRLRLETAARLLTGSQMTVGEIAAAAGFREQRYLCIAMRKKHGQTPLEYRRRLRLA